MIDSHPPISYNQTVRMLKIASLFCLSYCSLLIMATPVLAQTASTSTQLNITADVYAWPHEMNLSLDSSTHANDSIHQEYITTYTITYGSVSTISVPFEITVHYDAPSPDNSNEHLVDYVPNSATLAYNNTPAIIDQRNRTITWSIPSLPPNTDHQTITFQLKTNSRYMKTTTDALITVTAQVTKPFVLPIKTHQTKYLFQPHLVPPSPTPTPTPVPQTVANVRVYPSASIKELAITQLNSRSMTIKVKSNKNTILKVRYGSLPTQLKITQHSLSQSGSHLFKLNNLLPNTTYFLQFALQSGKTEYVHQDLYVFHTPTTAEEIELKKSYAVNLKNSQGIVFNGQLFATKNAPPVILLPHQSTLSFDFTLDGSIPLSTAELMLYQPDLNLPDIAAKSSVSFATPASSSSLRLPQIGKQFILPNKTGEFSLVSRIETAQGTIAESPLATIRLIKPMIIRHQKTGLPIADAKVVIHRFDTQSNTYQPYPNPTDEPLVLHSQADGSIPFIPQEGRFKFDVTRAPYYPKQVDLNIKLSSTMVLPDIELRPTAVSWLEPILQILAYFETNPATQLQALQDWLDIWSEALIGRKAFPTENAKLSTTESF